jgi:hypothetical protein
MFNQNKENQGSEFKHNIRFILLILEKLAQNKKLKPQEISR